LYIRVQVASDAKRKKRAEEEGEEEEEEEEEEERSSEIATLEIRMGESARNNR
jgi:hypothetical protein